MPEQLFARFIEANDRIGGIIRQKIHPLTGTRVWEDSFSFLLDRARYTEKFLSGSPEAECAGDKFDSIWIVTPERTEELSVPLNRGRAAGAIAARGTLRDSVDLPLGLRMYGQDDWVGEKDIKALRIDHKSDGTVIARSVESAARIVNEWEFGSKDDHFLVLRYSVYWHGLLFNEYISDQFRTIQGIQLPSHVLFRKWYWYLGKKYNDRTDDLVIDKYVLDSPENRAESYVMQWPTGALVLDQRNNLQLKVKSATRPIDDDAIYGIIKRQSGDAGATTKPAD